MSRRRQVIAQRRPIFLGCEGESEQAYGQLLNELLRACAVPVHLEVVNLNPGAGDPIARLRRAEQEIQRRQRRRSEFKAKAILMDSDQSMLDRGRHAEAQQLARRLGFHVIWQDPCHEAFLLRHLPGCQQRRPGTNRDATTALGAEWRDYAKPMTRVKLERRIGFAEVWCAAAVEPGLQTFLYDLGLPREL